MTQQSKKADTGNRRSEGKKQVGLPCSDAVAVAAVREPGVPAIEGTAVIQGKEPSANHPSQKSGRENVSEASHASEGTSTSSGFHNKELGRRGEEAAAKFLERKGMEILERNWTCGAGEADIIAREDDAILHFVEVKTRSGIEKGFPSEAVTPKKRERYERIALAYLAQGDMRDVSVVFDIISIVATGKNRAFLRYHRNAFSGCE
ncbi:MAG: YraN family protein [Eggerthellaceae bacterium]|jgi:putative endonuclease